LPLEHTEHSVQLLLFQLAVDLLQLLLLTLHALLDLSGLQRYQEKDK